MKRLRDEVLDQAAHAVAAVILTMPLSLIYSAPPVLTAIYGLLFGVVREISESGSPFSAGSLRDLLFWTIGGALPPLIL